jgi:hypothetical protein
LPAFAQYCDLGGAPIDSLRTPLIDGATSTAPLDVADPGAPPPIGDGMIPPPVNPGMSMVGSPTVIPSVPITPANDIENPSVQVPIDPAGLSAPGEFGPNTYAPPPPSTPGEDPGILHAPLDYVPPPASDQGVPIQSGGIAGSASNQRWGGQDTQDFGLYRHSTHLGAFQKVDDYGQEQQGNDSLDGLNHARSGATTTQDLYGSRYPLRPTKAIPQ